MSDDRKVQRDIPQDKLSETREQYEKDGYDVDVEVQRDGYYTINARRRYDYRDDEYSR
ncbi:hypothetical protein OE749_01455 [Aestuariibacter sp. AA17]|uniref:PepSY domain-containing protein n=1 Tax=Fluctibacter corallii TaxID=2984329 RepID=A0ABT3A3U8_9ALTE|nr:hypothetical protein [Aestuariibacter sp. AA17]MCV2883362.1 hypothetical protein [Aestuariibacter sp. AA17]